ncbi:MAG TPA: hypothetical protein PKV50_00055 [Prolixibacteraceae bacterium]|nr:hypothetical protein [Prolixibacteraceae bacterium]HQN92487.1 hypothetical protein [Prolixibacteraceae bacterium]HUM87889.1 hypothetical protein [Prolixibacteraceae bacterium]
MENKIVLGLIQKNMEEIKFLFETMLKEDKIDPLLIEITTLKAKSLYQELKLLLPKNSILLHGDKEENPEETELAETVAETQPVGSIKDEPETFSVETSISAPAEKRISITDEISNETPNNQEESVEEPSVEEILEPISEPTDDKNEIAESAEEIIAEAEDNLPEPTEEANIEENHKNQLSSEETLQEKEEIHEIISLIEEPRTETVSEAMLGEVEEIQPEEIKQAIEEFIAAEEQAIEPVETSEPTSLENIETPEEEENTNGKQIVDIESVLKEAESTEPSDKKVFGEKFSKEPSLNDKLSSGTTYESKIKGKPVTNLKGSIGLNDRFLYTRELFGNDSARYEEAIEKLDQFSNLLEAIEYLEKNFVWVKNNTSLKFMDLVKRRFEN